MKKKIIIIVLLLLLASVITMVVVKCNKDEENNKIENDNKIIEEAKNNFSEFAKTTKETKLYKKQNNKYVENGRINKDVYIELKNNESDVKYYYIESLDLYIYYGDITKSEKQEKNERYKYYIYFNNNITTKDKTSFYDQNNNLLYTINKSFDFKVLVKDKDRYGVVYNDELLYIKKDDVKKLYDNNNGSSNKEKVRTLLYHFIYNPWYTECNNDLCLKTKYFEEHLKYLKENNYFTLTLEELEMYIDGAINIPQNSVVLTIDDGTVIDGKDVTDLLEKYDARATIFLITAWASVDRFQSPNLALEAHTHNMHNQYECPGYGTQGGGIMCLDEEYVLNDLKTNQEKLGGSKYFSFPFFDFNERAIELVKKAGFNMSFIGQANTDGYAYPNKTDKYRVPRKTIFTGITMDEFIQYIK